MFEQIIYRRSTLLVGLLAVLALLLTVPASAATTVASDDASHYPSSWLNGQNFGTGYQAWSLSVTDPNYAGFLLGTSTVNGDSNGDGDIDTGDRAWEIFAVNGQEARAFRDFNYALQVGDQFHVEIDNRPLSAGSVGFTLDAGRGNYAVAFELPGPSSPYRLVDAAGAVNTPFGPTSDGLAVEITLVSNSSYNLSVTRLVDGARWSISGRPFRTGGSSITNLLLYNYGAGTDHFFNSIEVTNNQVPVAGNDSYTVDEDTTLTVPAPGVLGNDSDGDGDPLALTLDTTVTDGALTLNPDGSFEYVPDADFCGQDTFSYHVNDGEVDSTSATVTINITCINDPPVIDLNGPDSSGLDFALNYTAGDGPVLVQDADMTLTDIDGGVTGSAVSTGGDIFVSSWGGRRPGIIWRINPDTGSAVRINSGQYLRSPRMIELDASTQQLFVVEPPNHRRPSGLVIQVDTNTGAELPITSGGLLRDPWGIALESDGNILVSDLRSGIIRIDRASGSQTQLSPPGSQPAPLDMPDARGIAVDQYGNLFVTDASREMIYRVDPNTGVRTAVTAQGALGGPRDLAVAPDGSLHVVETFPTPQISKVDPDTGYKTVISSGGLVTAFSQGIAIDGNGNAITTDIRAGTVTETDSSTGQQSLLADVGRSSIGVATDTVVDNNVIAFAEAKIVNPLDGVDEVLAATVSYPNVTVSYDSANGILSLVGEDTIENYETILRSITYDNMSATPTAGDRTIEFIANDGDATSPTAVTTLTLELPNTPPVAEAGGPYQAEEGGNVPLSGSVTDPDAGDTHTFEWDMDYDGVTFDVEATGANPTFDAAILDGPSNRTVALRVTDSYGASHTDTAEVTINNVAPAATLSAPVSVDEGSDINLSLISPSDPSSADTTAGFEYAFDCGDGSGYGAFGTANSAACPTDDNGSRAVRAQIKDKDGGVSEYTANVTINNVAPTAVFNAPASVDEGSDIGLTMTGPFDPSSADTTAGFEYAFDCGDGSGYGAFSSTSTVTCPTDDNGTRTVRGQIRDKDGGFTEYTVNVTVNNVAPAITGLNLGAAVIDENESISLSGSFTDPGIQDTHTVVIDWGDGSSSTTINFTGGERSFSASHQYLDDAPSGTASDNYSISVTVTDDDGDVGSDSSSVTVNNVAPAIDSLTGPTEPVNIGDQSSVSVDVAFSDPGTLDTHDVTWSWGDGSSDTQAGATSPATQSHIYSTPGVYAVTVTVTDDDDGMVSQDYEYIVIYDPDGGFVTGGGWIDSPAGAYVDDPDLTGRANFGFVSKYKKGATTPTGQTEFQFKAGDLNFHSSSYEWLVVTGSSQAKYKGVGTINGSGNYGFMLTATDNDDDGDTFRIKIWDIDNGDAVVYDNQMGAGDDSYDGTEIGGGNIKVHNK